LSESVFMSETLKGLLPEDFQEVLTSDSPSFVPGQLQSISLYVEGGIDKFSVEFLTEEESARKVLLSSLHKTITLPSHFGSSLLKVESIEIKYPGPTLALRGLVTYK